MKWGSSFKLYSYRQNDSRASKVCPGWSFKVARDRGVQWSGSLHHGHGVTMGITRVNIEHKPSVTTWTRNQLSVSALFPSTSLFLSIMRRHIPREYKEIALQMSLNQHLPDPQISLYTGISIQSLIRKTTLQLTPWQPLKRTDALKRKNQASTSPQIQLLLMCVHTY